MFGSRRRLTAAEQLHDQPQLVLDHEGGEVGHDVGVVALAQGLDLLLQDTHTVRLHAELNRTKLIIRFSSRIGLLSCTHLTCS